MGERVLRALLIREWKVSRIWLIVATLLLMGNAVLYGGHFLAGYSVGTVGQRFLWDVIYPTVYGIQNPVAPVLPSHVDLQVAPGLFGFNAVVALALGVVLMTYERNQRGLLYAWTLPLKRANVFQVKWLLGCAAILFAMLCNTLLLVLGDIATRAGFPVSIAWYWVWINTLLTLVMFSAGSVVGTMVSSGLGAFLIGLLATASPLALGMIITRALNPFYTWSPSGANVNGHLTLAGRIGEWVSWLSPFYYTTQIVQMDTRSGSMPNPGGMPNGATTTVSSVSFIGSTPHLGWYTLLFLLILPVFYLLGRRLYAEAAVERYSDLFLFPRLWYFALAIVSLLTGTVAAQLISHATGWPFLVILILVGALFYLLSTVLLRRLNT